MTARLEGEAGTGAPADIVEAEAMASADAVAQRERALADRLRELRNRHHRLVDPLQYACSIAAEDLAGYQPAFGWEMGPATERQAKALEAAGILPDAVPNAGMAGKLLDRLAMRRAEGLATPKQIRFLEKRGFRHVGAWRFEDANAMIGRISKNGWKTPRGVDPPSYMPEPEPAPRPGECEPFMNMKAAAHG
jgi:hypothetical protein